MAAQTLRCPGCGAPAQTDSPACAHCGARLATVGCPGCFGMMFAGSRHCPHCGVRAQREEAEAEPGITCPRCAVPLGAGRVGEVPLHDCERCGGIWLGAEAFQAVVADRERQGAVLAFTAGPDARSQPEAQVRYAPCPRCGQMMNRINFARISGVVVDSCRTHGTWFDRDELRRIVEFVRAGGLEASRERDRARLEEERRRVEEIARENRLDDIRSGIRPVPDGDGELGDLLRVLGLRP